MSYLVHSSSVDIIDSEDIKIYKHLPIDVYTIAFSKFKGIFFQKYDYNTNHEKIYGDSTKIANHIVKSYGITDKNLGVLLSGGKGLGKSLTARLVIEQLINKYPIIVVNEYIPGIFDFLKSVSNSVFLFDEFEKTMAGNNDNSDNNTQATTKQDEMLSLLDGTNIGNHNLFLFTCNSLEKVNDNLKSRPGRIKYHYKFKSCSEETIRDYCKDNLLKKELENDIVTELLATRYVSLDIITALVNEVNNFDVSVSDALDYLNIESTILELEAIVTYGFGEEKTTRRVFIGKYRPGEKKLSFYVESSPKEDKENRVWEANIDVSMEDVHIPYFGYIDVSAVAAIEKNPYENEDDSWIYPTFYSIEIGEVGQQVTMSKVFGYGDSGLNKTTDLRKFRD